MRFRSHSQDGDVVAVTGVNTVSFALLTTSDVNAGLLGFAVQRTDPVADEKYFMAGFKVFQSMMPNPPQNVEVSTFDHPVQSFVWDDFTAKPDQNYTYEFYPLKGKAKNLDRSSAPLAITVHTEALYTDTAHDVFFNRGVASSQAYQRRFGSTPIDKLDPDKRAAAIDWLTRDLDDALLKFIDSTQPGDVLRGCFYEFAYPPATDALIAAIDRGVDVQIIIDEKDNKNQFPLKENQDELARSHFPAANLTARTARASVYAHNKFMVLHRDGAPQQVWTGSTNLTLSGVAGQTNVGHWVRDADVAASYQRYWDLLRGDPGARADDTPGQKRSKNAAFKTAVQQLTPVPDDLHLLPSGTTTIFSPRPDDSVLKSYATLLDQAKELGCITLAFGIGDTFKSLLAENTDHNALIFALLERKDQPDPRSKKQFITINAANNVYKAWGSYLRDPVYQWARETNTGALGLSTHVHYIHSKFMLVDPLGEDAIVVTGSANFSVASTTDNDENMIAIRGSYRAADIYFTEFNRLFNHYYFRSVTEEVHHQHDDDTASLFLDETDSWQQKYAPGKLKRKRLDIFGDIFIPPGQQPRG
jgi:phosphatidylserine/phosphatidylglycerophosphate/cardiolipin synthase-like enzyme